MALALCSITDVSDWLSQEGLDARLDDDRGQFADEAEQAIGTRLIEKASVKVAAYLSQRYKLEEYAGTGTPPTNTPPYVRGAVSIVAAYYISIRRNLPCSGALADAYRGVFEELQEIINGHLSLPEVVDSFEGRPFVANFHLDGTYRSAKFRKVDATSIGSQPTAPIKSHPEQNMGYFP